MGRQFLDIEAEHLDIKAIQGQTVVGTEYRSEAVPRTPWLG